MRNVTIVFIAGTALWGSAVLAQTMDDGYDAVVPADVLAAQTGRENLESPSILAADLGDNTLAGGTNGSNIVSDSAFSRNGGIAIVIQNSGNQVIIQNSTTINLTTN